MEVEFVVKVSKVNIGCLATCVYDLGLVFSFDGENNIFETSSCPVASLHVLYFILYFRIVRPFGGRFTVSPFFEYT